MRSWRARPDSPVPCSHSGSSSSNGSVSSSRHSSPTGAGTITSSRLPATTSSRSASRSASGARVGSRSPPRTSTPLSRCGRCATRFTETGSRIDASSSASNFTGRPRRERYWLLIERGDTEICKTNPGLDEDLYITAEAGSLRQMARRPAHLGPSHPRRPHPTRWLAVVGESVPNLERSQHVRAHQAGLPHRHELSLTAPTTLFASAEHQSHHDLSHQNTPAMSLPPGTRLGPYKSSRVWAPGAWAKCIRHTTQSSIVRSL